MPSTSVHFPQSLLEELDQIASESGLSRNRLIVEACLETMRQRRCWPHGFFDDSRFRPKDLQELRSGIEGFEKGLIAARRNRDAPSF